LSSPDEAPTIQSLIALVNPKSRSAGPSIVEDVKSLCAALGLEAEVRTIESEWTAAARRAFAERPDALVVFGGDGTARCVAEASDDGAPPLILLPGGTMNILPHALYGAVDWRTALTNAARAGRVSNLYGAEVDGRTFYVAGIFGSPALAQPAREAARAGDLVGAAAKLQRAASRAFRTKLSMHTSDDRLDEAEAVAVLCPQLDVGPEGEPELECAAVAAASLIDGARLGQVTVFGGWRNDAAINIRHARSIELRSRHRIPAILDGEAFSFDRRVKVRVAPHPVRVVTALAVS